jgi:UDP:flavonoid glycosyltransferase YjiC (YdhE family)
VRIVLATFGSLGDLHPFLALAIGLRERGCQPVIATHELYRQRIQKLGIEFAPLRPDYDPTQEHLNLLSMDPWRGTEVILREGLFPHLRDTYEDLLVAVQGASLLVSHTIAFPSSLVAEKFGLPWVSVSLAPIAMMSPADPPHAAPVPWVNKIWSFGPTANRALIGLLRKQTARWCEPIAQLRESLNLPRGQHPLFEGQHSPLLALALFSRVIGQPQPDWPSTARQTGFCFLDDARDMPAELDDFLSAGPPPVVFTLGSAAVLTAGDFFTESSRAIEKVGCRAVFIAGKESRIASAGNIFVTSYAPYSQVFRQAAAVVHQGGIGTTAQGLRAGRPALIVPFAHDQPDNAMRVVRAGAGLSIPRAKYSAPRAASVIRELLDNETYKAGAQRAAASLAQEDGVAAACSAILSAVSR